MKTGTQTEPNIPSPNLRQMGSKKNYKSLRATEIYFSPIDVTCSKVELSSPLPSPTVTPTQESYNTAQAVQKPASAKLRLGPDQLDRLLIALANAPMVQDQVRRQSWDDDRSLISSPASKMSLRTALKEVKPKDSVVSLTRKRSSTGPFRQNTVPATQETNAKQPLQVRLSGIALIEPKINGSPVRFLSKNYLWNTNVLRVGKGMFLNSPYGNDTACRLRIESAATNSTVPHCRVVLQVVAQVLDRKTGKKVHLLVADMDVTESFTKAAFTEFAEQSGIRLEDIEVKATSEDTKSETSSASIDWCELADELEMSCNINNIVDAAVEQLAHLDRETCSTQTLTLMSEIERIKLKHEDFLILRSHAEHENGVPSQMSVPWISQHLDGISLDSRTISSDSTREFREHLIATVAKQSIQNTPFATRLRLGCQERIVRFLPLVESTGEKNCAWVCFLTDVVELQGYSSRENIDNV